MYNPDPRVPMKSKMEKMQLTLPWLIVETPALTPTLLAPPPPTIISPNTISPIKLEPATPLHDNSIIAKQVKVRWIAQATSITAPMESIANRVARCWQVAINPVMDKDTSEILEDWALMQHPKFKDKWNVSAANEFGHFAQGVGGRVAGMNTIHFIHKHEVPNDRFEDTTYIRFVCQVQTDKKQWNRTQWTLSRNSSITPMMWIHPLPTCC